MTINELERIASQVRRDIIRMVHRCQSGHPGGSLGATDVVTALYFDQMQIDPANFRMDGNGEDPGASWLFPRQRAGYLPPSRHAPARASHPCRRPARHPHRIRFLGTRPLRRRRRGTSQEAERRQTSRLRPHGRR